MNAPIPAASKEGNRHKSASKIRKLCEKTG